MNAELKIKVVIIGDQGVGKTSITNVFVSESFDDNEKSTCCAAFQRKILFHEGSKFTFQIWDTAGQEKYQSLISLYYKDAQVALLVFDILDIESFQKIQLRVKDLRDHKKQIFIILVGNKSDLTDYDQIGYDQIKSYAASQNLAFRIVSAKQNEGITELFQFAAEEIKNNYSESQHIDSQNLQEYEHNEEKFSFI